MKKSTKRLLSGISAAVIALSAVNTAGAAEYYPSYEAGETEDLIEVPANETEVSSTITSTLSDDGTLTFSGTGELTYREARYFKGDRKKIKKIVIGDGIYSIGNNAFTSAGNMPNLTSVYIAPSVEIIGRNAFARRTMTEVTLSEGLKEIAPGAFRSCQKLKTITIPASVEKIHNNAFIYNYALTAINVASGNKNYSSSDGILFNKAATEMLTYPAGKPDTSYTLSGTVTKLDVHGMNSSLKLTTVNVGSNPNFTSAGGAIYNKDKSTLVCVPNGKNLKSFSVPSTVKTIGEHALSFAAVSSVSIPQSVTRIEDGALMACENLASVSLPSRLTYIGNEALADSGFTSISVPDSVSGIGWSAFSGCEKLTSVKLPGKLKTLSIDMFEACTALTSVTLPSSLETIEEYAFSSCESLRSIVIPDSVTSIGDNAFVYCTSLSDIKLSKNLTHLGAFAFEGCNALTKVTLPGSLKEIGDSLFIECNGSVDVTVSEGITDIGYAFMDTTGVASVTLPKTLKTIGEYAFSNSDVAAVNFAEGLESIGYCAFENCQGLTSVTLPTTLKTIEEHAFYECDNLKEIYVPDFWKGNLATYVGDDAFPETAEIKYYKTSTAPVTDPTKPVVTAEPTYGGAEVTWEPVKGAVNYRVYTFVPGGKIRQFGSDTTGTSMTVKGLKGGEKTGIIVLAQFANKKWSKYTDDDIAYVVPMDAVKPYLCVNPKGNGNYYLIWSSVPTSVRYKVMAREKGTKNWELIGATRSRCRITVEMDPNKQYDFLVRGLNAKNKYTPMTDDDIVAG